MPSRVDAVARQRVAANSGCATNRPQVREADPVGVAGELIFARHYGLDPESVYATGRDPGYDFVTPDGQTIDVKATNYTTPDGKGWMRVGLFADEGQVTADLYVLVYVDDLPGEKGRELGWATRAELLEAEIVEVQKAGTKYRLRGHRLHRTKLHPMSEFPLKKPPTPLRGYVVPVERDAPFREPFTTNGRECVITWDRLHRVGHIAFADGGQDRGVVIYAATNHKGKTSWHVLARLGGAAYGSWSDAAHAAVRIAIVQRLADPQPDLRLPAPVVTPAQPGLDI